MEDLRISKQLDALAASNVTANVLADVNDAPGPEMDRFKLAPDSPDSPDNQLILTPIITESQRANGY